MVVMLLLSIWLWREIRLSSHVCLSCCSLLSGRFQLRSWKKLSSIVLISTCRSAGLLECRRWIIAVRHCKVSCGSPVPLGSGEVRQHHARRTENRSSTEWGVTERRPFFWKNIDKVTPLWSASVCTCVLTDCGIITDEEDRKGNRPFLRWWQHPGDEPIWVWGALGSARFPGDFLRTCIQAKKQC